MQKIVLKVGLHDEKIKQKAMKIVSGIQGGGFNSSGIQGVDSVAVDMKENKMTVVGGIDPVKVAGKLRKLSEAEIVSVGPKEEPKKDEPKKEEKKPEPVPCVCHGYINHPYPYYCVTPVQQDPVGCVIS